MRDQAKNHNNCNEMTEQESDQFEFCHVCRLNHDQGRRHKYLPNHAKSLSSFLSRFQHKLSDVRFFLKNPSPLRPEHASRNRIWCVFCDSDIDEVGSSFACCNAINHLASADHLKNLKSFLWKYGGGMHKVDSFRISETDLAKWKKKCTSLRSGASSEGSHRPLIGPSNDIHNELNSECVDSFEKNTDRFLRSSFSNGVMPLQNYTNERYQVSHLELSEVTEVGPPVHNAKAYVASGTQFDTNPQGLTNLTAYVESQQPLVCDGGRYSASGSLCNGGMYQAHVQERMVNRESSPGLQNLSQISVRVQDGAEGNVHSGAPPPWFDANEENLQNLRLKRGPGPSNLASSLNKSGKSHKLNSSLNKSGKSHKLNPKRVGAAWAEKRKVEMEMEKRGEIVTNNFDVNWLPNFGRVWQSGSRKESRKEFEVENKSSLKKEFEVESKSSLKGETQSETLIKIQPYISKRMRTDSSK